MPKDIIVRVQSPDHGTRRINAKSSESLKDFLDKVRQEFELPASGWSLFQDRAKTRALTSSRSKTLTTFKLGHGDMLYLSGGDSDMTDASSSDFSMSRPASSQLSTSSYVTSTASSKSSSFVIEDEVDQVLAREDGRIHRDRNEQLCRHGPSGKCLHCVPLEPYDEAYLKSADPPIKFLSFHSYIRKMTGGIDKGKFVNLENISCKVRPGCTDHLPWPKGICTKCQPNAVTLNRQKYRHVDYIQFENPFLMERFLNYWRSTGNQRIGIMYGTYVPHKDVPLGIKAVVAAIYEPPQTSTKNSVELLEDEREYAVNSLAEQLGLRPVGWIFTDLVAKDLKTGTVKHFRGNINSHFLSAQECIMAADFQSKHPSPCKLSSEGHFGSKFVTVVVTGDSENQIHFEGYQVSNQCMALVRDDCLVPTKDAPELGYAKESSNEQYVPDVFYKEIDEYKNEVTQLARPLPVEYLLLDLPAAFPVDPITTFHAHASVKPFVIENRDTIGELQDFTAFTNYMSQFSPDQFLQSMSDFHVLIYMATCDMLPLKNVMADLLKAVKTRDEGLAYHWSKSECWGTVKELIKSFEGSPTVSRQTSFVGPGASPLPPIGAHVAEWSCKHCTLLNTSPDTCSMCGLPK